jgi:hypothetical protein
VRFTLRLQYFGTFIQLSDMKETYSTIALLVALIYWGVGRYERLKAESRVRLEVQKAQELYNRMRTVIADCEDNPSV